MNELELLERAALAAAIGLLIGIERGWQQREVRDGARVAGIRTYTLIGGLGGFVGLLAGHDKATLGLCFLAFALPFSFFEWQAARRAHTISITGLIAGLLTFALGAYAARGDIALAAAAGVLTAAVLAERRIMHVFLRRLKWSELRSALVLLVMTAVLLPVLPDRAIDPWNALNPYRIWLMTVLVGAVSYAGYVGIRLAGPRKGLLFAGMMGGIVSSTTVTWTFARLARRDETAFPAVLTAILVAWIISLLRVGLLAVTIQPTLLQSLAPSLFAAGLALAFPAALAYRAARTQEQNKLVLQDPFDLPLMLRLTVLLAGIMLLSKAFSSGRNGLFALGGLSGLLDVDPITLSMAQLAGAAVPLTVAAATILIAVTANGAAKAMLAFSFGGPRLGFMLILSALAAVAAGATVYVIT